jgi:hypothetical protein
MQANNFTWQTEIFWYAKNWNLQKKRNEKKQNAKNWSNDLFVEDSNY